MSLNKSQRQLEVFRLLQRLKRARPQEIFREMARLTGTAEDNLAFQRAVHRDLKSLQESYLVGVDYFTAGGEKIPPGAEDEHKNFRVEYYLLGSALQDKGSASYLKMGGDAIVHPHIDSVIHIEQDFSKIPEGAEVLSLEVQRGVFSHIWFLSEDRPLKFYIGRGSDASVELDYRQSVLQSLDKRTLLLLLPNSSISRFKPESVSGHCDLSFTRNLGECEICDRGSTFGTYWGETSKESLIALLGNSSDHTHGESGLGEVCWEQVTKPWLFSGSFALKVGELPMAVFIK